MATPSQANRIAGAAALLVFLVIALVVDREGEFTEPRTTTVVETEAQPGSPVQRVTTRVTFAGGRRVGSTRTTEVQTPAPASPPQEVKTTETAPPTGVERVLGDEILTFGLALLAAFLTAAALQRILLGRYGGARSDSEDLAKLDREIKLELARIHAMLAQLEKRIGEGRGTGESREAGDSDGAAEQVSEAQQHAERLAREAFALQGRN